MTPEVRRNLVLLAIVLLIVGLSIVFPAVLSFVEMGARELRIYWWLVLLVAVGGWLVFIGGRKGR